MDPLQHLGDKAAVERMVFFPDEPASKKTKVLLANKVLATVLWDIRSIIHLDFLHTGRRIRSEYFASLLYRLSDDLKKNVPHLDKTFF